jgi:hypothetical protein
MFGKTILALGVALTAAATSQAFAQIDEDTFTLPNAYLPDRSFHCSKLHGMYEGGGPDILNVSVMPRLGKVTATNGQVAYTWPISTASHELAPNNPTGWDYVKSDPDDPFNAVGIVWGLGPERMQWMMSVGHRDGHGTDQYSCEQLSGPGRTR